MVVRDPVAARGLAVLVRHPYTVTIAAEDPALPWLLATDVAMPQDEPIAVLGLWTVLEKGRPSYVKQAQEAIIAWERTCHAQGRDPWSRTVLAGDFNASMQGAQRDQHRATVDMLSERGMGSAYHLHVDCEHGQEAAHTLRWIGRGSVPYLYHCDYIFVSSDLQLGLSTSVGSEHDFMGRGLSDHLPVVVDVEVPRIHAQ